MRSIFITGAAQGIGRACAEAFAAAGWFVGAYDIDAQAVEAWAAEQGAGRARAGGLDVTDTQAWQAALADFVAAAGGRLDVLLNNAGILADGPFAELPLARQQAIFDVNLRGVLNGCHCAWPHLAAGSRVINMSSASALFGQPILVSYAASKFGVRGLTEGLNLEWSGAGIHVCDVMPLFVRTAMVAGMTQVEATKSLGVKIEPADVAKVVMRAATEKRPRLHYLVGGATHAFRALLRLTPDTLAVAINRRLSGR